MKEKDLLKLKTEINEARESSLKLEGELESLMKRLNKEFGCKTVAEAEKKLKEAEKRNKKYQKRIEEKIEKLQKDLNDEKS